MVLKFKEILPASLENQLAGNILKINCKKRLFVVHFGFNQTANSVGWT